MLLMSITAKFCLITSGTIAGAAFLFFWWFGALFISTSTIESVTRRAVQANKPSICYRLPKEIPDTMPRYDCLHQVAVATRNTQICADHLKGTPALGSCYREIAVQYKDATACDELRDVEGDYYPSAWDVMQCYTQYASANYDWDVCEHLSDHDRKFTCYMYGGKKSACDSMSTIQAKDDCYNYFGMCEKIDDTQMRQDCAFYNKRNPKEVSP